MPEEKKFEGDPLAWTPKSISDEPPAEVFDARMSLLSEEDADRLRADFASGRDPVFKYLYFGGDMFGDLGSNASGLMTRCVYVGEDAETSLRMFKASAYGPQLEDKYVPQMLDEATEFVGEFREEMSHMNGYNPGGKKTQSSRGKGR